jgi:PAS domain S-box-containing protein
MLYISPGFKELTGYDPEEVIGNRLLSFNDLIHPDHRQRVWEEWQRVIREGKPYEGEYPIITRNGEIKWVWERGRGVYTEEGKLFLEGFLIDITSLKEAQTRFKEKEEEYRQLSLEFRALLDAIPDNLTLQTPDLKIVWANRGAAASINKEVPELIGKHCYELWQGRSEPCLVCPVQRAFQSGKVEEDLVTTPDGRVWFLSSIPIKDEEGKVRNVVEMGRDITASHRAQEELRESEEKFHILVELSSDGIFLEDQHGNILDCNEAGARIYGYKKEEIIGKNIRDLVPEDFARTLPGVIDFDSGGVYEERRSKRKDGSIFPSEIATRLCTVRGERRLLAYLRDITEHKLAEEALRESEERWRTYIEQASDLIFTLDPSGRITSVNRAVCEALGYQAEELLGKSPLELVAPQARESTAEALNKVLNGEGVAQIEVPVLRRDGRLLTLELRGRRLYQEGKLVETLHIARDITERKLAEEALKESERRYHTLAEISPVGIFHTDAHGSTTYVNPKWCEISGLSKEEALGEGWFKAVHPEEREEVRKGWIEATREGRPSRAEYRFLRPDGKISWVIGQAIPQRNEKGEVLGYVGTITEITERKLMEKTLEEEKTKFEAMAQSAPYGMALVSQKGKWLYINPKFTEITGYSIEDVPDGKTWFRKAFPDPLYRKQVVQSWIESESSTTLMEKMSRIFRVTRKDGAERTFKITAVQIPMGDFLVTFEDITLQREMEEALRKSEEQYRTLVENLSEGVDIVDAEENFVFANPACEKIFGVPPGGLKGRNLKEFTAPGFERTLEEETEKRRRGYSSKYEFRIRRDDGQERDLLISAVPRLDDKGQYMGAMAIISDITEKKLLEQEAEKARSDFLFAVSHELKTPLFLMATAQEMISSLPTDVRLRRFLDYEELWNRNLIRLKMLIDNLVDAQRTEFTGLKLNLQRTEVRPIIEQALSDLAVLAERKEIHFIKNLDPLPPLEIDPEAILRVLHNLLSNAVKFSLPGGKVEVLLKKHEKKAQITIRDHGSGIEPEILPYLFKPFARAPDALKARISGTGLGLYVSKVLVEAHNGKIELQSEQGIGTTVKVFLPLPVE